MPFFFSPPPPSSATMSRPKRVSRPLRRLLEACDDGSFLHLLTLSLPGRLHCSLLPDRPSLPPGGLRARSRSLHQAGQQALGLQTRRAAPGIRLVAGPRVSALALSSPYSCSAAALPLHSPHCSPRPLCRCVRLGMHRVRGNYFSSGRPPCHFPDRRAAGRVGDCPALRGGASWPHGVTTFFAGLCGSPP